VAPGCVATLVPIGVMLWQRTAVLSASMPSEYPFADNPITGAGFWIGRLTAVKVLGHYLWLALWPMKLSADYSYRKLRSLTAVGGLDLLLAVAGIVALTAILWKRDRLHFSLSASPF